MRADCPGQGCCAIASTIMAVLPAHPSQAQSVGNLPSFMQVEGGEVSQSPLRQTFVSRFFCASGEISFSTETFTKSNT